MSDRTTVVIATRDRRERLLATLGHHAQLPERPRLIVVDNGSTDGTPAAVRGAWPDAVMIELAHNRGAAARNVGVEATDTPYVAFSDDDSWWEPGALDRAERLLESHSTVALLAARVLVGPEQRLDPTCEAMAASPLPADGCLPGPRILGFVACGVVVRRTDFLAVGGFDRRLGIGGEEELLALELASAGKDLVYADELVAHHHPARGGRTGRARNLIRNRLLVAWLRRPVGGALRQTVRSLAGPGNRIDAALGTFDALRSARWVARERRPVARPIEQALRALDHA